eukprot:evm.model.NODE_3956_length_9777_cov_39.554977.4
MADDTPSAPPPLPPQPLDYATDKENDDDALSVLFAESTRERASLLISASTPQQDQESHLIEVSPSLHLHVTLAEDTGPNGSLFAYSVWNGSVMLARHLDSNPTLVQGKRVIEFGAAGALPSLIALVHKCEFAMITDYPDERLLEAIRTSLKDVRNEPWLGLGQEEGGGEKERRVGVQCHLWGNDVERLLRAGGGRSRLEEGEGRTKRRNRGEADVDGGGQSTDGEDAAAAPAASTYDVALVGECLWLHDQHSNLLHSLFHTLRPGGIALVSFAHHVPGCEERDLGFFTLAAQRRGYGGRAGGEEEEEEEEEEEGLFLVTKVGEERMGHMHREGAMVTQFLYVMEKRVGREDEKEVEEEEGDRGLKGGKAMPTK